MEKFNELCDAQKIVYSARECCIFPIFLANEETMDRNW